MTRPEPRTEPTPMTDPAPPIELLTNAPREMEIAGVAYVVRDLDTDRLIALAKWFKDRAKNDVEAWDADEHVKDKWRAAIGRDIGTCQYDPGSEAFNLGCVTPAGAARALFMAIRDQPENAGKPVAEYAVAKWITDKIEDAAREAVRVVGDPKASSPASSGAGDNSSRGSGTGTSGAKAARSKKLKSSRRRK